MNCKKCNSEIKPGDAFFFFFCEKVEVSSETIRRMKRDFGESRIKNNVIQSLSKSGDC